MGACSALRSVSLASTDSTSMRETVYCVYSSQLVESVNVQYTDVEGPLRDLGISVCAGAPANSPPWKPRHKCIRQELHDG